MLASFRGQTLRRTFDRCYSSKKSCVEFPKQIFSAIQPTGEVHLGNYLGAIKNWIDLQNSKENVIFSIADLHSLSLPQNPTSLQKNIFLMTATLLGCGIDSDKTIFFKQSSVPQHTELYWIFGTLATMARLAHLPQFKEKTEKLKDVPCGIFMYPVLQAADIALYKATHVPVGQDQIQHIHFTNDLIKSFNRNFGETFPFTKALIDGTGSIKSLTDPKKKMSKSSFPKSRINLTDTPEDIVFKCKKAITDHTSRVYCDLEARPGVSNLLVIHSQLTGESIEKICKEMENIDTGKYKLVLAEIIIEKLKPVREKINEYLSSCDYLEKILRLGAEKASEIAESTMREVKRRIGISTEQEITQKLKIEAK